MKTLKFKTNINCSGCVAAVTPAMKALGAISWKVDTESPDKILEVKVEAISPKQVMDAIKETGYKIEPIELAGS